MLCTISSLMLLGGYCWTLSRISLPIPTFSVDHSPLPLCNQCGPSHKPIPPPHHLHQPYNALQPLLSLSVAKSFSPGPGVLNPAWHPRVQISSGRWWTQDRGLPRIWIASSRDYISGNPTWSVSASYSKHRRKWYCDRRRLAKSKAEPGVCL